MRDEVVERLKAALLPLAEVHLAYLFGSRARGQAGPLSDIDLAVVLDPSVAASDPLGARLRVADAAARALRRDDIDVVLLDRSPPLLRQEILSDGVLLVERDPALRIQLRVETLRQYTDAMRLVATSRQYLVDHLSG